MEVKKLTRKSIAQTLGTIFIILVLIIIAIAIVSLEIALWFIGILVIIPLDYVLFKIWHYYAHKDKDL